MALARNHCYVVASAGVAARRALAALVTAEAGLASVAAP
jgi:hypothetical protein